MLQGLKKVICTKHRLEEQNGFGFTLNKRRLWVTALPWVHTGRCFHIRPFPDFTDKPFSTGSLPKTFPQQQKFDITAPRWENQSSPHLGQGGTARFGPTSKMGLAGPGGPNTNGTRGSVPGRQEAGPGEEGRPLSFWGERMRPFTLQHRKMPSFVKARWHGCAVLPEAYRKPSTDWVNSKPFSSCTWTRDSSSIPLQFHSYPHDSMPGEQVDVITISQMRTLVLTGSDLFTVAQDQEEEPRRSPGLLASWPLRSLPCLTSQACIHSLPPPLLTHRAQVKRACTWAGFHVGIFGLWAMSEQGFATYIWSP